MLKRVSAALAVLLALLAGQAVAGPRNAELVFRVMAFNIRFDFPSDKNTGDNWDKRAPLVAATVKDSKATVVCFCEDKLDQIQDLRKLMPGWDFYGMGRDGRASETCSVAWNTAEWAKVEAGDFWLSDTPEKVASNTWGMKYPHKVTWATLQAVKDAKRRTVTFLSTHLDEHREMDEVRRKSVMVIRNWIAKNRPNQNVVIGGDFNATPGSPAHKAMIDPSAKPRLIDAFEATNSRDAHVSTHHNFTGKAGGGARIDWLVTGGNVQARDAKVDRWNKDGKFPSDHFAVSAEVEVGVDGSKKAGKPEKEDPKPQVGKEDGKKEDPRTPDAPPPVQPEQPKPEPASPEMPKPVTGDTPDAPPPVEPGLSPLDPEPPAKPKR